MDRFPAAFTVTSVWVMTLSSVALVSAISLVGALTLTVRAALLTSSLLLLVSFAAGALLGDAFIHLLPEVTEAHGGFTLSVSVSILVGIFAFFILEKALHWHHSHFPAQEVLHPVAVTNLVGDALHNFLDGVAVAVGFLASPGTGLATAVAVALHEIPQELGDFGILVHAGLAPKRALAFNFLSGLTALLGAAVTLLVAGAANRVEEFLVPIIAGSFIYIGSTDLLPELHKEPELKKSGLQAVGLAAGVGVMALLLVIE